MGDRRENKEDSSLLGWCHCLNVLPCISDSGCSSLTVLFEEGLIQSLHYPEDYTNMADCNWIFQAPKHYLIKVLTLVTFTLLWYLHRTSNISTMRAEIFTWLIHSWIDPFMLFFALAIGYLDYILNHCYYKLLLFNLSPLLPKFWNLLQWQRGQIVKGNCSWLLIFKFLRPCCFRPNSGDTGSISPRELMVRKAFFLSVSRDVIHYEHHYLGPIHTTDSY